MIPIWRSPGQRLASWIGAVMLSLVGGPSWLHSPCCGRTQCTPTLARILHKLSTAVPHSSALTVLCFLGLLGVLQEYTCGALRGTPSHRGACGPSSRRLHLRNEDNLCRTRAWLQDRAELERETWNAMVEDQRPRRLSAPIPTNRTTARIHKRTKERKNESGGSAPPLRPYIFQPEFLKMTVFTFGRKKLWKEKMLLL